MALKFAAEPLSHLEQKIYLLLESEGKNVFTVKELKKFKFLHRLRDREAIRRVHASTNPYVPRKLRVSWVEIAREIKEKIEDEL